MAIQMYPEPKAKPVKFSNNSDNENDRKDFVLRALQLHFRGDMQLVFKHLPEFMESPALKALLEKLNDLEKEVFEVWEMEGYGKVAGEEEKSASLQQDLPSESEPNPTFPRKVMLPNGKVQQPYRFDLSTAFPELIFEGAASLVTEGHESAGMKLDAQSFTLSGIPSEAGHYQVGFRFLQPGKETENLTADLHIIPDPRLLWKEVEPEENQLFASEHTQNQTVTSHSKYLHGASRRGRSHAHTGAFREDFFDLDLLPDDDSDGEWLFAAVADGAGSAKYSRRGAKEACQEAIQIIIRTDLKQLEDELIGQMAACNNIVGDLDQERIKEASAKVLGTAAKGAWEFIAKEAEEMGLEASDFHTTLLLTAARKFDFGWWIGAWWVGDGAIGLYRAGKSIEILGNPDGGQFAGQTRFLTSKEVWAEENAMQNRISFAIVDDFTALALMTDGVSDPMFQTDYNMGQLEKWDAFWTDLSASVDLSFPNRKADDQLLEWLNFWSTGDHDDRTIVLIV